MIWVIVFIILVTVLLVSLNHLSPKDTPSQTDLNNALDSEPDFDVTSDDISHIFMEETHIMLSNINNLLIDWRKAPDNKMIQIDIRRNFHSLKGGGRLVGANALADVSYSVERIFNHLLDNHITASDELIDFISLASQEMGILASNFEKKQSPTEEYKNIIEQAATFTK